MTSVTAYNNMGLLAVFPASLVYKLIYRLIQLNEKEIKDSEDVSNQKSTQKNLVLNHTLQQICKCHCYTLLHRIGELFQNFFSSHRLSDVYV